MNKKLNIFKGVVIILLLVYITFKFLINSLFQTGNPSFEDNGRIMLVFALIILFLIYVSNLIYKKIKIKNLDIKYIREIPNYYSIPVVAFLYNNKIKTKSLIMAIILKLYDLNLITISKEKNKIIYETKDFKNIDKISKSEKYILDWLLDSEKTKYSYKQLIDVITDELSNNKLIKEKSLKTIICIALLVGIVPILQMLGYIPFNIYDYLLIFFVILLFLFMIFSKFKPTINKDYSKKGLEEHYNVLGFYNFLKDFSLLSKRKMEEYSLWKEYLQFAVLFNINKNYILKDRLNNLTFNELLDYIEQLGK